MGKQARISRQKLIEQGVDLSKPKQAATNRQERLGDTTVFLDPDTGKTTLVIYDLKKLEMLEPSIRTDMLKQPDKIVIKDPTATLEQIKIVTGIDGWQQYKR